MAGCTHFGPDPPVASLPAGFQKCLPPNPPSEECDQLVGPSGGPATYCARPEYACTTYCSCVNAPTPCPEVAFAPCANSYYAYQTKREMAPDSDVHKACLTRPLCINLVEVDGDQNVVSGITQECGVIQNITNVLGTNPVLATLAFVLFILLVVVVAMRTDDGGARPPPPTPYGLFEDSQAGPPF